MDKLKHIKITPSQKKSLVIAIILALIVKIIPMLNFIIYYYTITAHELGHAITGWVYGYISIPTFDFINGGGTTYYVSRPVILQFLVVCIIFFLLYKANTKSEKNITVTIIIIATIFCFTFLSPAHTFLLSFMGIGGELSFGFIIGWYALSMLKLSMNKKAVIYLFLATILWLNTIWFAVDLLFSRVSMSKYLTGKDGIQNDLVKLSDLSGLPISFYCIAIVILSCYLLILLLSICQRRFLSKY